MNLYIAADHRGFSLKEYLKTQFPDLIDRGAVALNPDDDDVDFATAAVKDLGPDDRAILLCGSGHGMDMAANKFAHVRAILGFNRQVVIMGREHEDANVLVLPAEWITQDQAVDAIKLFLTTPFSGQDRYRRRLQKLASLGINH